MEEKKLIEFRNIVKSFDTQVVLKGINLDIYENEFVTLLGPSGCGKTTLLNSIGGLSKIDKGSIYVDEEKITKVSVNKIDKINEFLRKDSDSWTIKDDKIQFTNLNRMTEYYNLLNQLTD
mgnify:CR=1 FL=1